MLMEKDYLCEIDSEIMVAGYFEAMGIKVVKNKRRNVECVVLKNQESITRIQDNLKNMEVHGFVPVTKTESKRNQSVGNYNNKYRDKNFRIMKKTIL